MIPSEVRIVILNKSHKPMGKQTITIVEEKMDGTVVYIKRQGNGFLIGEGRFIPRGLWNEGA